MSEQDNLERKLSELLEDGEMAPEDKVAREVRQISPKYEIRIQTKLDPIVEETLRYRKIGRELDDRYDKYLERAGQSPGPKDDSQDRES
ncbi:hypothetical protein GCM10010912_63310 [Paenibacillus albidus]|uniref:Uncharacterized protein n=1 Tax=Paenibacillus albidus TaxID=2041023 RepID=A0A917D5A2_9BACL|nr:hypothetical protein [Paenibacillus albidus]GGG10223.1 hypothetical protein GCM10010912_63310 [Paenibacillus albidus]